MSPTSPVVGVDDTGFGKRLRAFIVTRPEEHRDTDEIMQLRPRQPSSLQECPATWRSSTNSPERHRKLLRPVLIDMDVDS